jgi:hypothetical protein
MAPSISANASLVMPLPRASQKITWDDAGMRAASFSPSSANLARASRSLEMATSSTVVRRNPQLPPKLRARPT